MCWSKPGLSSLLRSLLWQGCLVLQIAPFQALVCSQKPPWKWTFAPKANSPNQTIDFQGRTAAMFVSGAMFGACTTLREITSVRCLITYLGRYERYTKKSMWVFPKIVVPQNGWSWWKTLLKWMIWGPTIFGNIHGMFMHCLPTGSEFCPSRRSEKNTFISGI